MKKIIVAISIGLLFLIVSITYVIFSVQKPKTNTSPTIPTPTPIIPGSSKTIPLLVVRTTPTDGTTQLSSQQPISISFNKTITPNDITVSSFPPVDFTQTVKDTTLVLTPQQNYENNLLYTLTLEDATSHQILTTLHFSAGTSPTATPMQDANIQQDADSFDRTNYPDVFLTNQLPYSTKDFSVTSHYVDITPVGHYAFTVTQNDSAAKQNFLTWLQSLGLTESQIQSLDISYH